MKVNLPVGLRRLVKLWSFKRNTNFKKTRDCDFIHEHQGTKAAVQVSSLSFVVASHLLITHFILRN
jgi:hypothetical protein